MSNLNIQMKKRNSTNTDWDYMYPITTMDNTYNKIGDNLNEALVKSISTRKDYKVKTNEFYDKFSNYNYLTQVQSLKDYMILNGSSYIDSVGCLNVTGTDFNTLALGVKRKFGEGKVIVKIEYTTQGWAISLFKHRVNKSKLMIWRNGAGSSNQNQIQIGEISSTGTLTTIGGFTMPTTTEDYYVEIFSPTRYTGAAIAIRAWGVSGTRPSTAGYTYTLGAGSICSTNGDEYVYLSSCATAQIAKFKEILITDGYDYPNPLFKSYNFVGRWFTRTTSTTSYMCAINQGATILCTVYGMQDSASTFDIVANFKNISTTGRTPVVAVSINGGAYTRYTIADTVTIATGLASNSVTSIKILAEAIDEHDYTWNQGQGLLFGGLTFTGNAYAEPYYPNSKNIMFIGDSITAGVNITGTGANTTVNAARLSYPQLVCSRLNALPVQVGFGSTGLVKPVGNGEVPDALTYTQFKMHLKWTDDNPDVIVINEGTNDESYGATQAQFTTAYNNLLDYLQNTYPNTPIFCIEPPCIMFDGTVIQSICNARTGVYYIDTKDLTLTFTDGIHPDTAGQATLAQRVGDVIENTLSKVFFNG